MSIKIFCDGGSRGNPGPAACAFVVKDDNNKIIFWKGVYLGVATNNIAEYSAVIEALKLLSTSPLPFPSPTLPLAGRFDRIELGEGLGGEVFFYLDSELVVKQLNGIYKIKDKNILQKVLDIRHLILNKKKYSVFFSHIPREQNHEADKIVNETLDSIQ